MSYASQSQLKEVANKINDNFAKKTGSYVSMSCGNLVDSRADSVTRKFTFDTACGSASISDNGTATIKKLKGNFVNCNQLVSNTNANVVSAEDGSISVTDAVAGNVVSSVFKGETIVMNQYINEFKDTITYTSMTLTLSSDKHSITFVGSSDGSESSGRDLTTENIPFVPNHVYYIDLRAKGTVGTYSSSVGSSYFWRAVFGGSPFMQINYSEVFSPKIVTAPSTATSAGYGIALREVSGMNLTVTPQIIDLTLMFGAGNEPTTVATVQAIIGTDYIAYNAGSLQSNNSKWSTAVWNQLNYNGNFTDTTGWTPNSHSTFTASNNILTATALANQTYIQVITDTSKYISLYEGHKYYLASKVMSYPSVSYIEIGILNEWTNIGKVTVTSSYNDIATIITASASSLKGRYSITLRLPESSTGGETATFKDFMLIDLTTLFGAGNEPSTVSDAKSKILALGYDLDEYQAYNAGTAIGGAVDLSTVLPKSAGSVYDVFDAQSGLFTHNIGSVDMGTLAWQYNPSGYTVPIFYAVVTGRNNGSVNIISPAYATAVNTSGWGSIPNKQMRGNSSGTEIAIHDESYTSASDLKTALSGKTLYYELATPTTETLTAQSLTMRAGTNYVFQNAGTILNTDLDLTYNGTHYNITLTNGHKYAFRDNGSDQSALINCTSVGQTQAVVGGEDKLIDLTKMFGADNEPTSWAELYHFYPLLRNNSTLTYKVGSLAGYKGTGIETIGFNMINPDELALGTINSSTGAEATGTNVVRTGFIEVTSYNDGDDGTNGYELSSDTYGTRYRSDSAIFCYDASKTFISSSAFTTSSGSYSNTEHYWRIKVNANVRYIRFVFRPVSPATLTVEDIKTANPQFHICWSGYRNYGADTYSAEDFWKKTHSFPVQDIQMHATKAYIISGATQFTSGWLTATEGSTTPLTPTSGSAYKIMSSGDYYGKTYFWDSTVYNEDTTGRNKMFPSGLLRAGSVYDEVTSTSAIKRVGTRAYQSGDESNSSYETDLTTTFYPLSTTITVTFDDDATTGSANQTSAIDFSYSVNDFGTEKSLPEDTTVFPTYAPLYGEIAYNSDFTRTIATLPQNYISESSMENFFSALGTELNKNIYASYKEGTWNFGILSKTVNWSDIAKATNLGKVKEYFTGTIATTALGSSMNMRLAAVDKVEVVNASLAHRAVVEFEKVIAVKQFCAPQALIACPDGLSAGTYKVNLYKESRVYYLNEGLHNKDVYFTLSQAIPAGGVIKSVTDLRSNGTTIGVTDLVFASYGPASNGTRTVIESSIACASSGTNVTDLGYANKVDNNTIVNATDRCVYGSCRWYTSVLRQWLNSDDKTFVWTAMSPFDMPPSSGYTGSGFLYTLDSTLKSLIKKTINTVNLNWFDGGGTETVEDYVFLPSHSQYYMTSNTTEGEAFDYYKEHSSVGSPSTSADTARVKDCESGVSCTYYWDRTPYASTSSIECIVFRTTGAISSTNAYGSYGVSPAVTVG